MDELPILLSKKDRLENKILWPFNSAEELEKLLHELHEVKNQIAFCQAQRAALIEANQ